MTGRQFLAALAVCLFAANASAQAVKEEIFTEGVVGGVITDGVNQWEITGASATDGVLTDYEVPIGTDHQFSNWWWYRVAGDSAETIMPPPDLEDYTGSVATLNWNDVDGRGLIAARLVVQVLNAPPGSALVQTFAVRNISGANVDLQLFSYTDMDLDASSSNDSAALGAAPPFLIDLVDVSTGGARGFYPDAYRVEAFPAVRNALNDTQIDNFADTGLPFGPGDYTGAFQWSWVLASGLEQQFFTLICVNVAVPCDQATPVFIDGFETGNTANWDAVVAQ